MHDVSWNVLKLLVSMDIGLVSGVGGVTKRDVGTEDEESFGE